MSLPFFTAIYTRLDTGCLGDSLSFLSSISWPLELYREILSQSAREKACSIFLRYSLYFLFYLLGGKSSYTSASELVLFLGYLPKILPR